MSKRNGTIILCFIHPAMKRKSYLYWNQCVAILLEPSCFSEQIRHQEFVYLATTPQKNRPHFDWCFVRPPPRTFYWETAVIHVFDVWPRFLETAELFYRDNFPAFGDTQRSPRNHQHDLKTFSFCKNCQMQRHQLGFNPQKTTYLFQEVFGKYITMFIPSAKQTK